MIVHALTNNDAPLTGAPEILVHMQLLSYEPLSPAASISVPATPHNTPADHPVYATLTVPNPNHYMVYDVQVRTLPIEYMCTFTAKYKTHHFKQ